MGQKMPAIRINLTNVPQDPRWYVVVTKFNYEKKFAKDLFAGLDHSDPELADLILETIVPFKEEGIEVRNGKEKKVTKVEKVYPLYVFVRAIMKPKVWDYIRNTAGASTILAANGSPMIIGDAEIQKIKELCGLFEKEKKDARLRRMNCIELTKRKCKVGSKIKVVDGMFNGYEGFITSLSPDKDKVMASMNNSPLNVEINIMDLELN